MQALGSHKIIQYYTLAFSQFAKKSVWRFLLLTAAVYTVPGVVLLTDISEQLIQIRMINHHVNQIDKDSLKLKEC